MTKTLKDVRKLAKQLGAVVEDEKIGNAHECCVEAPHRKLWSCCGIHELVDCAYRPWKPDYSDLLDRMGYGLEDCVGPCDWCDGDECGDALNIVDSVRRLIP